MENKRLTVIKNGKKLLPLGGIFLGACLLLLPQLYTHQMLLGSDSIFHYNRFYDTYMQLKEGNFQYFISMYGFQSSGRIVNALYGPIIAYINGFLLLLGKTWFNYQVLSDLVVYLLAGSSLYYLLRRAKVRVDLSLFLALFYMTTYAIQYWVQNQAFSGWAAALLPLSLVPVVTFVTKKEVNVLELACCTALITQTHFLTSLFVIMAYIPAFLYAFWQSKTRGRLLKRLFQAIGLFLLLTANIWGSMLEIYQGDHLLRPFINKNMASTAIALTSYRLGNWLAPFGIIIFSVLLIFWLLGGWKKLSPLSRLVSLEALTFLILSSRLLPWQWLSTHIPFVSLLQFPFRFFVPYTVLLLLALGTFANELALKKQKIVVGGALVITLLGMGQTAQILFKELAVWSEPTNFMYEKNTTFTQSDPEKIKQAFYSHDLSLGLEYVQKSTPDYLPVHTDTIDPRKVHGYRRYHAQVISKEALFNKAVKNNKLIITWQADANEQRQVPVFIYRNTKLVLNGRPLAKEQLTYTWIGAVMLKQRKGFNKLEVTYAENKLTLTTLWLTGLSWGICGLIGLKRKIRRRNF